MTRKWMERSLEECVNTCFNQFLDRSTEPTAVMDFESEINKICNLHNTKPSYPFRILWVLTSKCNLRCKHCMHLESGFFDQDQELTTEQIFKVIDEIHNMTVPSIMITGGEPFARKDFFDILQYLKKRNISTSILSNGTMIDEKIISKLKTVLNPDIDYLSLSLDGTKNIHEEIRGKGTYDKAINAIKNLINEGFKINVNFTALSMNLETLPDVFKLCAELGVSSFSVASMKVFNNKQNYLSTDQGLFFKVNTEIIDLLKKYPDIKYLDGSIHKKEFYNIIDYIKYLTPENKKEIYDYIKENDQQTFLCHSGALCYINPAGLVFPCDVCDNGTDYFLMGDLKKESFKDILGRRFNNVILQERNLADIEGCRDCDFSSICKGNCPGMTYLKQKSIYKQPAECNIGEKKCIF